MENENITGERVLLLRYMTILFLLVSFLSILGLFLLSRIYWKDAAVAEIHKSSVTYKKSNTELLQSTPSTQSGTIYIV